MQYADALYGNIEIEEPVLQELLDSDALRRARGVSQHGITALLGITPPFSRFEHSVGVMLLVRRLGASVQEQVAALLHDVSHTAFSHVVDFVFDDHSEQSYHERKKEWFVSGSDIPAVLRRHGMDWRDVMDEEQFSLLEQPAPDLCADRLDYFLRDLDFLGLAGETEIRAAVESLVVAEGKIAVTSVEAARWMGYTYMEADRASWSSFREVGLYQLAAEAIKVAMGDGEVDEQDLWGSDQALWCRLRSAQHPRVKALVRQITPGTRFVWNELEPHFRVAPKVRTIDPPVLCSERVTPLSALDPMFEHARRQYVAGKQGPWPMAVVSAPEIDPA